MSDSLDDEGMIDDASGNSSAAESRSETCQSDKTSRSRLLIYGGLLLVAVIVLLLVPIPSKGRTATAIGDSVHAPLFGGLTLVVLALLHRFWPEPRTGNGLIKRCLMVGAATFSFGVCMEVMQHLSGRTGNLHDAVANGLGISAALLFLFACRQKVRWPNHPWLKPVLLGFAAVAFAMAWLRPAKMLIDELAMSRNFPILASFDSDSEISRFYFRECTASLSDQHATEGPHSLAVAYQGTPNPSFTLTEMLHDWSDMASLELDVTLDRSYPADQVMFVVSVLDKHRANYSTDLFSRGWKLKPGETTHLSIDRADILNGPKTRSMDLTAIEFLDMGLDRPVAPVVLRVDALKLRLRGETEAN